MPLLSSSAETWALALQRIREGGVIAFPTDTVYGVGCDPYNTDAVEKLFALKGRDREKALPLLLGDVEQCAIVARELPETARRLGAAFWPGALTLVVPRAADLPPELGGGDTIAVRIPAHEDLAAFLRVSGPLASSSANLSGRPDARTAGQVEQYFGNGVDLIIDGGTTPGGVPSTVVSCTSDPPHVLREGPVNREAIERALSGWG